MIENPLWIVAIALAIIGIWAVCSIRMIRKEVRVGLIDVFLRKMADFGSWFFNTPVAISVFLFFIAVFGFWMAWELLQIRKELKKFGKNEKKKGEQE